MAELLKVLKFLYISAFKALCRIRYKGLYAFLSGVMIFSVCFAGKGELHGEFADNAKTAAEAGVFTNKAISFSSDFLGVTETKAQRVPYEVYTSEASVLSGKTAVYDEFEASDAVGTDNPYHAETFLLSPDEGDSDNLNSDNSDSGVLTEIDTEWDLESVSESDQNGISAPEEERADEETDERWTETKVSGIKYINTDKIYSRTDAIEGSEKIKLYRINDTVKIAAITDTHYYKTESGEFIHEDYISEEETPKWTETAAESVMYISSGGIYSRKEAIEGSEKVNRYNLNDTVNIVAETDTHYCKLDSGEFIHSDFLSPTEIVEYPLSGAYGQRAQTDWERDLAQQVFEVVNAVRADYGLNPVKQLDSLTAAATERAWEATFKTSHTRPDGTKCFTVLDEYGLSNSSSKAENIAKWYPTAQKVVDCWMNDYAHRVNILGDHEYMGVGCYYIEGDYYGYYWTQMFYTP